MKIPLNFSTTSNSRGLISLMMSIRIPAWRVYGLVKFYVDTGSPKSFIGYDDAVRLQIPFQKITFTDRAILGGNPLLIGEIKTNVNLFFKTEKESIPFKPSIFYVSKGVDAKRMTGVSGTPSILGYDFFLDNKLALYYDPAIDSAFIRESYITKETPA